jgi:D-alanyl-D-alanine carboxypeptidase
LFHKILYTIFGFGLAVLFFPHVARDVKQPQPQVSGISITSSAAPSLSAPEVTTTLAAPILTAKSALAIDLDSGSILYSKKLNERLPIASVTKLMTALVVLDQVDLKSILTVPENDQTVVGTSIGLIAGEQISVENLLKAMLIPSSNDAALLLATFTAGSEERFAQLMNNKATQLGLTNTHFTNPVGWDIDDNFSDALDLVKVSKEFLKHPELAQIVSTKQTTITSTDGKVIHTLTTTNKLLLDNPEVIGLKTGFTAKALGNLITLVNHDGHKILTIVLGSDNREDDSQKLLDWLFAVYKW